MKSVHMNILVAVLLGSLYGLGCTWADSSTRSQQRSTRATDIPVRLLVLLGPNQGGSLRWSVPFREGLTLADVALLSSEYDGAWQDVSSLRIYSRSNDRVRLELKGPVPLARQDSIYLRQDDVVIAVVSGCSPRPRFSRVVYRGVSDGGSSIVYWNPNLTVRDLLGYHEIEGSCVVVLSADAERPRYHIVLAGKPSGPLLNRRLQPYDAAAILRAGTVLVFGEVERTRVLRTASIDEWPQEIRRSHRVYLLGAPWRPWWPIAEVARIAWEAITPGSQILWVPKSCVRTSELVGVFVAPRRAGTPCMSSRSKRLNWSLW